MKTCFTSLMHCICFSLHFLFYPSEFSISQTISYLWFWLTLTISGPLICSKLLCHKIKKKINIKNLKWSSFWLLDHVRIQVIVIMFSTLLSWSKYSPLVSFVELSRNFLPIFFPIFAIYKKKNMLFIILIAILKKIFVNRTVWFSGFYSIRLSRIWFSS